MAKTPHLFNRNGRWYYRRRVPEHLAAVIGKKIVQFSLHTADKKQATKLCRLADVEWDARFDQAELDLAQAPSNAPPPPISPQRAEQLVRAYVERMDRQFHERRMDDAPGSRAERSELQMDVEIELGMLRNPEDPRGDQLIDSTTRAILRDEGIAPGNAQTVQCGEIVRRGLIELCRRRMACYEDDFERPHFDHLFDPRRPSPLTFGELADQYLDQMLEEAELNGLTEKWTDKVRARVALMREIVGEATPVDTIDYDICRGAASILARTPSNRHKLYPKLSLETAIEKAAKQGKPTLAVQTQAQYLSALKDILELATLKRLLPHNPASSLRPLKRERIAENEKRRPFTLDQIETFFRSDFYHSFAPGADKPYAKSDRHWRFWLPLICLFMGMRPNEVCQLRLADVRATAKGTHYFDIASSSDDDDGEADGAKGPKKTIKTATSRRRVPIHPELIKLGLLTFVAKRVKAEGDQARLLPGLKPDQHGNLATYALKRFRDTFLPQAIALEPRQTFYSFRHSFRDALRRCNAPPSTLQALGGWSQGNLTSDAYGDKFDPDHQLQWIERVQYPGLDLSFLHIHK